jgi:hypothetical protein
MNGIDTSPTHPRLSRETRRLLTTVVVALVALWVLARVRFPDRPVTPNPIPPVLTQLSARPVLGDLAAEIGQLRGRLGPSLVIIGMTKRDPRIGLRLGNDAAVTLSPAGPPASAPADVLAHDRTTGLAIVRVPPVNRGAFPVPWPLDQSSAPVYLAAASPLADSFLLEPVLIGALQPMASQAWSGPVWQVPSSTRLEPGTMLFTSEGEFAGVLVREGGVPAIVPGDTMLADAQRLLDRREVPAGTLGLFAQTLTPALAAATKASTGVIVARVEPRGPAASQLAVGDVVESVAGSKVTTLREWEAITERITAGERIELTVRRFGDPRVVTVVAAPETMAPATALGLTLLWVDGLGSEVVRVDRGSAAQQAGLRPGDFITSIGRTSTPAPAQIRRAFAAASSGESLLVGISRDDRAEVLALTK